MYQFETIDFDIFQVKELLAGIVKQMIGEAQGKITNSPSQPKEPLIRLKVDYINEDHAINEIRFGQQFNQQVNNVLQIYENTCFDI